MAATVVGVGIDLIRPVRATVTAVCFFGPFPRAGMKRYLVLAAIFVGFGSACTGETAVPIDLNSTTVPAVESSTIPGVLDPENPNEAQNQVAVGYAEQQCLDDPDLEEGYVRIVVPETEEIVGEITVDCEQVRTGSVGNE